MQHATKSQRELQRLERHRQVIEMELQKNEKSPVLISDSTSESEIETIEVDPWCDVPRTSKPPRKIRSASIERYYKSRKNERRSLSSSKSIISNDFEKIVELEIAQYGGDVAFVPTSIKKPLSISSSQSKTTTNSFIEQYKEFKASFSEEFESRNSQKSPQENKEKYEGNSYQRSPKRQEILKDSYRKSPVSHHKSSEQLESYRNGECRSYHGKSPKSYENHQRSSKSYEEPRNHVNSDPRSPRSYEEPRNLENHQRSLQNPFHKRSSSKDPRDHVNSDPRISSTHQSISSSNQTQKTPPIVFLDDWDETSPPVYQSKVVTKEIKDWSESSDEETLNKTQKNKSKTSEESYNVGASSSGLQKSLRSNHLRLSTSDESQDSFQTIKKSINVERSPRQLDDLQQRLLMMSKEKPVEKPIIEVSNGSEYKAEANGTSKEVIKPSMDDDWDEELPTTMSNTQESTEVIKNVAKPSLDDDWDEEPTPTSNSNRSNVEDSIKNDISTKPASKIDDWSEDECTVIENVTKKPKIVDDWSDEDTAASESTQKLNNSHENASFNGKSNQKSSAYNGTLQFEATKSFNSKPITFRAEDPRCRDPMDYYDDNKSTPSRFDKRIPPIRRKNFNNNFRNGRESSQESFHTARSSFSPFSPPISPPEGANQSNFSNLKNQKKFEDWD